MITKRSLADLAISGGAPAFAEPLHVGRPNAVGRDRFVTRMNEIMDRRWFTNNGPCVQELEHRLSEYLGVAHCIACCNATVGLELAIRAAGLSGEVIIPAFTFVATAHALQWQQITPVFCDVDPATHMIDPRRVEALITPRTTGIIGVHLWGDTCDVEAIGRIAERHRLQLLFDAAHAFGCSRNGPMVGSFGAAEVFSFHATKFLHTFEGGLIATNDATLAARIRLMRNFGFGGLDDVTYVGTNGKMNELSAAMGLAQLEFLDQLLAANTANHALYLDGLRGLHGVRVRDYDPAHRSNRQYVVAEIDQQRAGLTRDQLVQVLWAENVLARRYFFPGCHRMEPYRSLFPHAGLLLPETEALCERVLQLPTGSAVEASDIDLVCSILRTALHDPEETGASLPRQPLHREQMAPPRFPERVP